MKDFIKNTSAWIVAYVISFAIMGLYRLTVLIFSAWADTDTLTITMAILVVSVAGGAIQTVKTRRRNRRAAQIIPMLLAEAIEAQQIRLARIDAEPPSAGKTRRRTTCKITLVALEEKRDRMISGKDGRSKRESRTFEHETPMVGKNPGRGENAGDQENSPQE